MSLTLSAYVRQHTKCIDISVERLTCTAKKINVIDIHPAALSTLTAKAPVEVRLQSEQYVSDQPALTKGGAESSDERYFNVALALSLHTVLLSRNQLHSLLGVVQFKHVVRLSLLGNRIRCIEDCEPLALLPELRFLSLEFNPVCSLPHYRAHLLRITSWPGTLSRGGCRLRKLDAKAVTLSDAHRAMLCLQREQALMPAMVHRVRLETVLARLEATVRLHKEMQQRGLLREAPSAPPTPEKSPVTLRLTQCAGAAMAAVSGAALDHLARRAVAAQPPRRTCTPTGAVVPDSKTVALPSRTKEVIDAEKSVDAVIDMDVSVETRTSDDGTVTVISLQDSLSEISLEDLSWARPSPKEVEEQKASEESCKSWSASRFRQALSAADVKVCIHLLRIARTLGVPLLSRDVDELCLDWAQIVARHVPASPQEVNVTGPRSTAVRTVNTARRATAVSSAGKGSGSSDAVPHAVNRSPGSAPPISPEGASGLSASSDHGGGSTASDAKAGEITACSGVSSISGVASPSPRESARPLLLSPAPSVETGDVTEQLIREAASSTTSEISPRAQPPALPEPPVPSCASFDAKKPRVVSSLSLQQALRCSSPPPSGAALAAAGTDAVEASTGAVACNKEDADVEQKNEAPMTADDDTRRSAFTDCRAAAIKRRTLLQWQRARQRRLQERQCEDYRAEKLVSCADNLPALVNLSLLKALPYTQRKGLLFRSWYTKVVEQRVTRQIRCGFVLRVWQQRAMESGRLAEWRAHRERLSRNVTFQRWRERASLAVVARCRAAKERASGRLSIPRSATSSSSQTASPSLPRATPNESTPEEKDNRDEYQVVWGPRSPSSVAEPDAMGQQVPCASDALPQRQRMNGATANVPPVVPKSSPPSPHESSLSPSDQSSALTAQPSLSSLTKTEGSTSLGTSERNSFLTSQLSLCSPDTLRYRANSAVRMRTAAPFTSSTTVSSPPSRARVAPVSGHRAMRSPEAQHAAEFTRSSPFSEDDVAALVVKASALAADREGLAKRLAVLQKDLGAARAQNATGCSTISALRERLSAMEQRLTARDAEREQTMKESRYLKRCVVALREERREWLEQALSQPKPIDKFPFTS